MFIIINIGPDLLPLITDSRLKFKDFTSKLNG